MGRYRKWSQNGGTRRSLNGKFESFQSVREGAERGSEFRSRGKSVSFPRPPQPPHIPARDSRVYGRNSSKNRRNSRISRLGSVAKREKKSPLRWKTNERSIYIVRVYTIRSCFPLGRIDLTFLSILNRRVVNRHWDHQLCSVLSSLLINKFYEEIVEWHAFSFHENHRNPEKWIFLRSIETISLEEFYKK